MPKYPFAMLIAVFLVCSGCGLFSDEGPAEADTERDVKANIPFKVKEPERYSAQVVVSTNADGKILDSTYFVARDGKNRLEKFAVGKEGEFSILVTQNNESYRLFPPRKQYEGLKESGLAGSSGSMAKSMTSRWLNSEKPVSFVDLGNKNGLKKYRAEIEESRDTEIIIFIDEKLNYPVKQEIWSLRDGNRKLLYSMELRDISLNPDPSLFVIPRDYTIKPDSLVDEQLKK